MSERRSILVTPRIKELKHKKSVNKRRKVILIVSLLILLIIGLSLLSYMKAMRIETVLIKGNTIISDEDILNVVQKELFGSYLLVFSKQNFLLYPKASIENNIKNKIKRIDGVNIALGDSHTLVINVIEREGKFLWCGYSFDEKVGDTPDSNCYFLNEVGLIFAKAPYFSGNVYFKFYGTGNFAEGSDPIGQQFLPVLEVSEARRLIVALEKLNISPYALSLGENGDRTMYISSIEPNQNVYTKIIWNDKSNIETIVKNLETALSTEPLKTDFVKNFNNLIYIDLRFENKVYYKFKTETADL